MPRLQLRISPESPWTKTPNALFDTLMPELRDTELRILLVLIRRTLGWHRGNRSIALSYRTLKAATGRESEAIRNALDSLSARGVIHIE